MKTKYILIALSIIVLITIVFFYVYILGLASAWNTNKNMHSCPYFTVTKPIVVKNILLPPATRIFYDGKYPEKEGMLDKMLDEKEITSINFEYVENLINWGGLPITNISINNEKRLTIGVNIYYNCLKGEENQRKSKELYNYPGFYCQDLYVNIKNTNDWSFNLDNIKDIKSYGMFYREFYEDKKIPQNILDTYIKTAKIKIYALPFFITNKPTMVKNMLVPKGTKLIYERQSPDQEGIQYKILDEEKLTEIILDENNPDAYVNWGGIPASHFKKISDENYSVIINVWTLEYEKDNVVYGFNIAEDNLRISVKNMNDWTYNTQNIKEIQNDSVLYDKYDKNENFKQNFIDIYVQYLMQKKSKVLYKIERQ